MARRCWNRLRLAADFGQRLGVLLAIDGDAHNVRARFIEQINQRDRRVDVLRVRRGHALDGDRVATANRDRANTNGSSWMASNFHLSP